MIKALSKVDKFIKQTQLLKEHKLVYELFSPSQFKQSLLTIPSLRWRVILYWRKAPWHMMDCRMDQVTWLSFSPWCCFQPSLLRLGSIIFYKSCVPFYLIYCGICIEPDNFRNPCLSLIISSLPKLFSWCPWAPAELNTADTLSCHSAWWGLCMTDRSLCQVCLWHWSKQKNLLSEGTCSITSVLWWVFTVPSEGGSKGWRLEWSCHVANGISVR